MGEEFLAIVGNRPLPGGISVLSFAQLMEEQPQLRRQVRRYLHANGWLGLHLTGETAFDPANACFSGLCATFENNGWSARLCDYFGVERDWLPAIRCGSETLGGLRPAVAAEWGLPPGIPVKLGTAGHLVGDASGAAGTGRVAARRRHHAGAGRDRAAAAARPTPTDPRLGVGPDYVYVTHKPVGGVALTWLRELCYREQSSSEFFEQTVPAAIDRPTWVRLDPPFLGGDRLNIEAHRASLCELTLDTTRDDLLAAVLQAMRRGHAERGGGAGQCSATGGGADRPHGGRLVASASADWRVRDGYHRRVGGRFVAWLRSGCSTRRGECGCVQGDAGDIR
jgi:sugar (pentulose or hexulose) kinase